MVTITSICELKNFASFQNFTSETSPYQNFQHYNLFYGLNGCGKTTFSRLFDFLNRGKIPNETKEDIDQYQDFEKVEFKIKLDNGTFITNFSHNPFVNKIRVFNSDFVKNNLKLEKAHTKSLIYNIGEVSSKLKIKKNLLERSIACYYNKNNNLIIEEKINAEKKKLDEKYQNLAKQLRDLLNLPPSFNKTKIETKFNQLKQIPILQDNEREKILLLYRQDTKQELHFDIQNISNNYLNKVTFDKYRELLYTVKKRKSGETETIIKWLTEGLELHKNEHQKCIFCSQNIDPKYWEERYLEIKKIIEKDDDFEKFEQQLREAICEISKYIKFIDDFNILVIKESFLQEYQNQANAIFLNISENQLKAKYKNMLSNLLDLLKNKLAFPDTSISLPDSSYYKEYLNALTQLNACIQQNNIDCRKQAQQKENYKEQIISSILLPEQSEIAKMKSYITKAKTTKQMILDRIRTKNKKLSLVTQQLNNQTLPIKEIDNICEQIFGYKKFIFTYNEKDNSYNIERNDNNLAINISEGEKTVIAFAYFIACLKENNFSAQDGILVIDDPISSLDQQYLFNIYVVLSREILKESAYNQVFILTHNFYFFRKIRNSIKNIAKLKDTNKKRDFNNISASIYSIEQSGGKSTIQNASKYLLNYESEYLHLIRKLHSDTINVDDEFCDVGIGNAIRQVLEIFLSFKCPNETNLYTRFHSVKPDNKYKYLYDLANSMSHTDETDNELSTTEYKIIAGKKEIEELFEFINAIDSDHYSKLKKII